MVEQDSTSSPADAQPTAGTSDKQTGGQGYPEVGKWEYNVEGKGLVPTIMEP